MCRWRDFSSYCMSRFAAVLLVCCCSLTVLPAYVAAIGEEDGKVLAYLIELFRRQNKACGDGTALAAPPPLLLYSAPLSDALLESQQSGREMKDALAAKQLVATQLLLLTAGDLKARDAFESMKANYCPQLMQPYTHVGAVRGDNQWRVALAVVKPLSQNGAANGTHSAAPGAVPGAPPSRSDNGTPSGVPGSNGTRPDAAKAVPVKPVPSTPFTAPVLPAGTVSKAATPEASTLLDLINTVRRKGAVCRGKQLPAVTALVENPKLYRAAQKHAMDMDTNRYFSTKSPSGVTLDKRLAEEQYAWRLVTQLIAKGPPPTSAVLDLWLSNPSQCEQLLDPLFTEAGIGYSSGYWSLFIGTPAESQPGPPLPGEPQPIMGIPPDQRR